jgi:hypothetical protein
MHPDEVKKRVCSEAATETMAQSFMLNAITLVVEKYSHAGEAVEQYFDQ